MLRTLSPENRKVARSSHNTQGGGGRKDLEGEESMFGLRNNNSSSSALRPAHRSATVGHHSDDRVAKRKQLVDSASNVDDDLVDSILNVSTFVF